MANKFLASIFKSGKYSDPTGDGLWGMRTNPISGKSEYHKGLDLVATGDNSILSPVNGKVTVSKGKETGNMVQIKDTTGYTYVLMHLADGLKVKNGQTVSVGDVIGTEGKTGSTTGDHVHFEIWKGDRLTGTNLSPALFNPPNDSVKKRTLTAAEKQIQDNYAAASEYPFIIDQENVNMYDPSPGDKTYVSNVPKDKDSTLTTKIIKFAFYALLILIFVVLIFFSLKGVSLNANRSTT